MKFLDIMRISLHNMWNNKTRTLLVTLVLLILSSLVTMILAFCINMMDVVNFQNSQQDSPVDIRFEYNYYDGGEKFISNEEIDNFKTNIFEPNKNILSSIMYSSRNLSVYKKEGHGNSASNVALINIDSNPYENLPNNLLAGRMWNKDDINKPYIWINSNYAMNNNIQVGDILTASTSKYDENRFLIDSIEKDFEVVGILNKMPIGWNSAEVIISSEYIKELDIQISSMQMTSSTKIKPSVFEIIKIGEIAKEYNEYDYKKNQTGIEVQSRKASEAQNMIYMTVGVIAGGFVLSLFVILLSIGCVSNSIQITVEQNRKFFGVMKAVGLRDNTVKKIVRYQALIMVIIAVAGASGIGVGILGAVKPMILNAMKVELSAVAFGLPIYLPFVVFAMLMLLILIHTRKSLNKISKMDVVSVISEVN